MNRDPLPVAAPLFRRGERKRALGRPGSSAGGGNLLREMVNAVFQKETAVAPRSAPQVTLHQRGSARRSRTVNPKTVWVLRPNQAKLACDGLDFKHGLNVESPGEVEAKVDGSVVVEDAADDDPTDVKDLITRLIDDNLVQPAVVPDVGSEPSVMMVADEEQNIYKILGPYVLVVEQEEQNSYNILDPSPPPDV